jgi:hypothetical protein
VLPEEDIEEVTDCDSDPTTELPECEETNDDVNTSEDTKTTEDASQVASNVASGNSKYLPADLIGQR